MQSNAFAQVVQVIFGLIWLGAIYFGILFLRNHERWFGVDAALPSEGASSRTYTKVMVFIVWAHVFLLSGSFTFLLH